MATYNPLLLKRQKLAEEQAELERQIAIERAQARTTALLHIKQLIATFSITAGEIAPQLLPGITRANKAGSKAKKRKPGRPPRQSR